MLLTIPRLLFPQTILTALKQNKLILVSAVIEMIINIGASIFLAQRFGLVGVAYGTVAAFVAEKILMTFILYYKYDISPSRYISFLPFSIYSLLTILSYWVSLGL
jgi:O-antigen/teichoic acid export membrane protein